MNLSEFGRVLQLVTSTVPPEYGGGSGFDRQVMDVIDHMIRNGGEVQLAEPPPPPHPRFALLLGE